jgi:outer membrane protein assembly factor BamB
LDGTIQTFDAQTGDLRWEIETPYRFLGPPAIADNRLVVPTTDGRVLVLNGRTGRGINDKSNAVGAPSRAAPPSPATRPSSAETSAPSGP